MSEIKKAEQQKVKRMNLNVPVEVHNRFKSITAAEGKEMTEVILKFVEEYVEKHQASQAKKGRRQ